MLTFRAHRQRQNDAHNERVWLAWNTAALYRVKRMPNIQKMMMGKDALPKRRQTWQEQMAIMDRWASVTRRKRWQAQLPSP